ncbi:helix-turn-helix domain-containing protein [Candidatus Neomicrothrix sp.]|jgi:excisionase family DNA binding protein|uniref:helix-turn-helix domain-containing protein n=1 Tax=Candidatus Neomicrothrix sp. TaxID=2719034 RepID=UPI001B513053|nr:helix-turn-helix domain-containing protein [Candidatus Microthrix sp.]MBP7988835.1 helix-turn-helix domain-containing protein [Candidatus Microthrix sp.]
MTTAAPTKLAYTRREAAAACGVSVDVIDKAIKAGDLRAVRPTIDGRKLATILIRHTELERWLAEGGGS